MAKVSNYKNTFISQIQIQFVCEFILKHIYQTSTKMSRNPFRVNMYRQMEEDNAKKEAQERREEEIRQAEKKRAEEELRQKKEELEREAQKLYEEMKKEYLKKL